MANQSIFAAFERMWAHVVNALGGKADVGHTHTEYMFASDPVGTGSFSMNRKTGSVIGSNSHAEGLDTIASGDGSHAEGLCTIASGVTSHAEGMSTCTTSDSTVSPSASSWTDAGACGHAEGYGTVSYGFASHAEGNGTDAEGKASHAEGQLTRAQGDYSHAEGIGTIAEGDASHAEGVETEAIGTASHAEGNKTSAFQYQHVQGHYNYNIAEGSIAGTEGVAFVIGNGAPGHLSNAFRVDYNGVPYAQSYLVASGADYAEFFEWQDLNPNDEDRRGYFVTLDGDKIKIAEPNDYILGIISGLPAVIGNGDENWRGRYILDDFGAFITEEFEYEEDVFDKETGEKKTVTKTGTKYKENPDYDPSLPYIQRKDRPEWDAVGMFGVLAVRDDGTCTVNGYCTVAEGGIATASESGYRVIKRVSDNVVRVVFK